MSGYKTYLGGAMIMIPALLQMAGIGIDASNGVPIDMGALQQVLAIFGAGLGMVGLGHKLDKSAGNVVDVLAKATSVAGAVQAGIAAGKAQTAAVNVGGQ